VLCKIIRYRLIAVADRAGRKLLHPEVLIWKDLFGMKWNLKMRPEFLRITDVRLRCSTVTTLVVYLYARVPNPRQAYRGPSGSPEVITPKGVFSSGALKKLYPVSAGVCSKLKAE
jgi:hypothetical protein